MKITKRQLRRIIRETVYGINGTPQDWDRDEWTGAADAPMSEASSVPVPADGAFAAAEWCFNSGMDWRQCVDPLLQVGWPEEELALIEQEFEEMVSMELDMEGSESDMYHFETNFRRRLKSIIQEEFQKNNLNENWHAMSRNGQQIAQVAKRRFRKLYPAVPVGIMAKQGWITVGTERVKAVNMSQASRKPSTPQGVDEIDHMVNQMIEKAEKHGLI